LANDAVPHLSQERASTSHVNDDAGLSRIDKIVLSASFGVPVTLIIACLVYWFGFHDTWEQDNYSQIEHRCAIIQTAVENDDDETVVMAYENLRSCFQMARS